MIRAVLCDIEGTTTSIAFAHEVLFPVSYEKMESFLKEHWNNPAISRELDALRAQITKENVTADDVITLLRSWIRSDKKETNLKSIQGKIWKESFESGTIRGHVYPDVPVCFKKWKAEGMKIAIFSSGSVEAQQLIFRYSDAGDLSPYIDAYFDTTTGPKKEAASYRAIAEKLQASAEEILFLSDVEAELDAAREAGMKTTLLIRDGKELQSSHPVANNFNQVL
jgi:enolase-phosphatase E1